MKTLIFLIFFPFCVFAQPKQEYKNLVMECAGVRGLAYAGALSVLEEKGILKEIENICGSSSGTIAGLLVSLGYTSGEIKKLIEELPVQQFNDGGWGIPGKYFRFKKHYGVYKGKKFQQWLEDRVQEKTGNPLLSFADLYSLHLKDPLYKNLYCTGTNVSKQQLEVFSYLTTPDMPVALASRISCGVPIYFEAIALDNNMKPIDKHDTSSFINYYVDGGMICNYPISLFDTCVSGNGDPLLCSEVKYNPATLGIKLETEKQIQSFERGEIAIPAYKIKNAKDYVGAFANLMMESLARKYPGMENEKGRTIYVSQGDISPRVKKTKQQDKLLIYNNGISAAKKFIEE